MNEDRSNEPLDKAAETAALLCDNVYRRIRGRQKKLPIRYRRYMPPLGLSGLEVRPAVPRWEPRWGDRLEH